MKNILKSKKGESMLELLVSILITGASGSLMAIMLTTSTNLNIQAEKGDKEFYIESNMAETKEIRNDILNEDITITISRETDSATFKLDVYGKEKNNAIFAFGKK